jgi:tetratricopeptide (TPR) repeat protein
MRRWPATVSLAALMSSAAMADDKADCLGHKDAGVRIKSCSAVIGRAPRDATVFYHRGLAHAAKDDLDQAVADYTHALELNPPYGPAYESRGRIYARKGDLRSDPR